jgi:cytidylate kinase
MNMPVITVRGQMGSGAPEVGKQIAAKLHIDYVDREIIAQVAQQLRWTERGIEVKEMPAGSLGGKIAEAFSHYGATGPGAYGFQGVYLPTWEIPLDDTRYLAGLSSVIRELAESNSIVIRGRGSQFILKDHPGAFHVLTPAHQGVRVKRVMEDMKIDEETARKEITRFDSSRREFTKRYFRAELEDPANYDIVINTSVISYKDAAAIIIKALKSKMKITQEQKAGK